MRDSCTQHHKGCGQTKVSHSPTSPIWLPTLTPFKGPAHSPHHRPPPPTCLLLSSLLLQEESESRSVVSDSLRPHGLHSPWNSPGQNTGVGSCSLLQGIFSTQGLNPGLLHCRQILYQLGRKGNPRTEYMLAKKKKTKLRLSCQSNG